MVSFVDELTLLFSQLSIADNTAAYVPHHIGKCSIEDSLSQKNIYYVPEIVTSEKQAIKSVCTEDTGKSFEMALCLAFGVPYDGIFKYSLELPNRLKSRLEKFSSIFPKCYHSAKNGSRYDFTTFDGKSHLSAKSTKKGVGKVAPQVIGQLQPKAFCSFFGIDFVSITNLKKYIQTNIISILPKLVKYTFECPIIYFNQADDSIRFITLIKPIDWGKFKKSIVWTCNWEQWNNSSTLKIRIGGKSVSLLEFQFHTNSRSNMSIRWHFENFLQFFSDHLTITDF